MRLGKKGDVLLVCSTEHKPLQSQEKIQSKTLNSKLPWGTCSSSRHPHRHGVISEIHTGQTARWLLAQSQLLLPKLQEGKSGYFSPCPVACTTAQVLHCCCICFVIYYWSETRNARVIQQITKEQKERRNCCRSCWDSFKIVCMCLCVTGQRKRESHRWAAVKKKACITAEMSGQRSWHRCAEATLSSCTDVACQHQFRASCCAWLATGLGFPTEILGG